jgi:hypothetical protein
MKSLIFGSTVCIGLMTGCCPKPVPTIEYVDRIVEVKVPVKCVIEMPEKPVAGSSNAETLLNIKQWIMLVNEAVKTCQ